MPTVANYTVIQDTDVRLGETDDVQFVFDAPNLTVSTSNSNRPMLLLKLNPHADDARLEVVLNNNLIYGQTFSALTHGQLLPAGNTLNVANRLTGDFTVSDLTVMFKADI